MSSDPVVTENLAQAIQQVAKKARSEEDLRVGVEHALGATLEALGLTVTPEYVAAAQTSEVSETSEVSRQLAAVEAQVDQAAAELWGITDRELKEIRRSLEELG